MTIKTMLGAGGTPSLPPPPEPGQEHQAHGDHRQMGVSTHHVTESFQGPLMC